ncbi:MAG: phenylalanine--tRNA ligase subunit beta [bacterium]|nr:phenylalanine--tRNA ligase subunit beta [bacterium]
MKFSFSLIKKLAPGKYTKSELVEKFNLHLFETVDLGGDALEIVVSPNRFSDAASHLGIAMETAAIFGTKLSDPNSGELKFNSKSPGVFRVNIQDKKLSRRYLAGYVSEVKIASSPIWLKEILETCGLRSINNVVDIMNYVMLKTGQPMHAFDADKVSGGIVVRKAKKGEKIDTIDNQTFSLDKEMLVIADAKKNLAIAGIKGGKNSEIDSNTKRILVESANFDSASIYDTSKKLGLRTDASVRFSHNLSPELAELGIKTALDLLQKFAGGKIHPYIDVYPKKQSKKLLRLDIDKMASLIGKDLKEKEVVNLLSQLGFSAKGGFASGGKKQGKNIEVPALRTDINDSEDLAEEVARLIGYNNLIAKPPAVALGFAAEEELILLKDRIRNFLAGAGFSEVYNYSLISKEDLALGPVKIFGSGDGVLLANPMSRQLAVLRDSLSPGLLKNLKDNLRFFEEVRIFEIGNVFSQSKTGTDEKTLLGIALASKNAVLELKGLLDILLEKLGLVDYFLPDLNYDNKLLKTGESLRIETGDHKVLGYMGSVHGVKGAILELDLGKLLKLVDEEKEYEPLSKFPSVMRDISILADNQIRVGEILAMIQRISLKLVEDVDLIDWYQDEKLGDNKKSLTFRIVFRAEDRTLTDQEVDREMAAINQILINKFDVELR